MGFTSCEIKVHVEWVRGLEASREWLEIMEPTQLFYGVALNIIHSV
jgi:hypothetical protein